MLFTGATIFLFCQRQFQNYVQILLVLAPSSNEFIFTYLCCSDDHNIIKSSYFIIAKLIYSVKFPTSLTHFLIHSVIFAYILVPVFHTGKHSIKRLNVHRATICQCQNKTRVSSWKSLGHNSLISSPTTVE